MADEYDFLLTHDEAERVSRPHANQTQSVASRIENAYERIAAANSNMVRVPGSSDSLIDASEIISFHAHPDLRQEDAHKGKIELALQLRGSPGATVYRDVTPAALEKFADDYTKAMEAQRGHAARERGRAA